jgi:hypothetical protein
MTEQTMTEQTMTEGKNYNECTWTDDCWYVNQTVNQNCCPFPISTEIPWINYVNRPRMRISRNKKQIPPACDITGDWLITYMSGGTDYVHRASFVQSIGVVTGSGGYPVPGPETYSWTATGFVNGSNITLKQNISGACSGVENMTGVIDCVNKTMTGTFSRTIPTAGSCGPAEGTWTASMV